MQTISYAVDVGRLCSEQRTLFHILLHCTIILSFWLRLIQQIIKNANKNTAEVWLNVPLTENTISDLEFTQYTIKHPVILLSGAHFLA